MSGYRMQTASDVQTAVVPAAGAGTRWLPLTTAVPKELLPVVDRPAMHWILDEAVRCGIGRVILVTAPGKDSLTRYASQAAAGFPVVEVVVQPEPLGLGDAVRRALPLIADEAAVAIMLPDNLFDEEPLPLTRMITTYRQQRCSVLALMACPADEIGQHGAAAVSYEGEVARVTNVVEKPGQEQSAGRLAVVGRYVLTQAVLAHLTRLRPARAGEYQLTDAIAAALPGERVVGVRIRRAVHDVGSPGNWLKTQLRMGSRDMNLEPRLRQALAAGAALLDRDD